MTKPTLFSSIYTDYEMGNQLTIVNYIEFLGRAKTFRLSFTCFSVERQKSRSGELNSKLMRN
jgi:hypothetical protein